MEHISEYLSFLIILKEAIQIIARNGKLTALFSLLVPSLLFLSFSHACLHYLTTVMHAGPGDPGYDDPSHIPQMILGEMALLFDYLVISHQSVIAAILVASESCTGKSKDLFMSMETLSAVSHALRQTWTNRRFFFIFFLALLVVSAYPHIFIITSGIVVGAVIVDSMVYLLSSDVWALSLVVLVLEEEKIGCCSEAMEKLGDLVEGHQLKGAMLNLFSTLLFIIFCILFWVFKDQDPILYGLLFINAISIMKMVLFMAYTLLYFQCRTKKHPAGEEII